MDIPRQTSPRKRRRVVIGLAAALAAVAAIIAVGRLRPAAPSIDRATVWIDTVKRSAMVREVGGQGTLVPEEVHWISATSSARVERVLSRPGATVTETTVLMVLANPDLELAALEAERQVASAEADLVNLRSTLDGQRLTQQSHVASLGSELGDARRRATADDELAGKGYLSTLEHEQSRARAAELAGRLAFERQRLAALKHGHAAQLAAQRQQVERQRAVAAVRRRAVDDLTVRAGVAGVLQQLSMQPGQMVVAGTALAKVARPDRLKAEIRVPETQAKDVQPGLAATIDTRSAIVPGHVTRVDPAVQGGFVKVDVAFDQGPPAGVRPDLNVAATIELERLNDVLLVGRPAVGGSGSTVGLMKIDQRGDYAQRTPVQLGRASLKSIEVVSGLREGDRVILSDLSQWDAADRVHLK